MGRTEHSGTRNSTDAVLQPILGPVHATDEARRLPPQTNGGGAFAFLYPKNHVDLAGPAMAFSILAWPSDAWIIPWDGSEVARRRLDSAAEGRRFFIGSHPSISGYRFEQMGPQFWKLIPGDPQ